MDMIYQELSKDIIGACMAVHKELGCGFLESVYSDALEYEFKALVIPYKREFAIPVVYKGNILNRIFRIDFLCYDKVVLELKAFERILPIHKVQLLNYLKLSQFKLGFVINFGSTSLEWERIPNLY